MTNYVKSEIKSLPNFDGSQEHQGGLNSPEYIQWFKLDDKEDYLGLTPKEASDLVNILNKQCSANVIGNSVEGIEEDDLPYIAFSPTSHFIIEYELSNILDY